MSAKNQSLSILVVEDNLINQRLIMAALVRLGHQVANAPNGEVAVKMFQENSYDAILMDIMMPVMDGVTACKAIRAIEMQRGIADADRIKIIAVTANAFDNDRENFMNSGMDEMMNKPIDIDELQQLLFQ